MLKRFVIHAQLYINRKKNYQYFDRIAYSYFELQNSKENLFL